MSAIRLMLVATTLMIFAASSLDAQKGAITAPVLDKYFAGLRAAEWVFPYDECFRKATDRDDVGMAWSALADATEEEEGRKKAEVPRLKKAFEALLAKHCGPRRPQWIDQDPGGTYTAVAVKV